MKMQFKKIYILFIILVIGGATVLVFYFDRQKTLAYKEVEIGAQVIEPAPELKEKIVSVEIGDGATYGNLMKENNVVYGEADAIYQAAFPLYDLASIRVGKKIDLVYDPTGENLEEVRYNIDTEEELFVRKTETGSSSDILWTAELLPIPYEVKTKIAEGRVESSMYEAALENDIDIRAIIELANAFQWTLDFAMDPRVGDEFKFVYEERYLDDEYIMPGQVLAGVYENNGTRYEVYYFKESDENKGYFDQEGNSVQKIFLRAPVSYKYISSGYTGGARYVSAFSMYTSSHRAIDYAADYGSPVRAVGDGTIAFTRYSNSGYGNFISLRHNGTYVTQYAHLSKIYVKGGQKVKQGEVIGAVGSTGFSTGPHLHYEMLKNGVKVNALKEILPPGNPIKEENKQRFIEERNKYRELLKIDQ